MKALLNEIVENSSQLYRDGHELLLDGATDRLAARLEDVGDELIAALEPPSTPEALAITQALLKTLGGACRYVTTASAAKRTVKNLLALKAPLGFDTETVVLDDFKGQAHQARHYRQASAD